MDLRKSSLAIDGARAVSGVPVAVPDSEVYEGGKLVRAMFVVCARANNPSYQEARTKWLASHVNPATGRVRQLRDEAFEQSERELQADHVKLGWLMEGEVHDPARGYEHVAVEPFELDGEPFPPTRINRMRLLADPDFIDLVAWWDRACGDREQFRRAAEEAAVSD